MKDVLMRTAAALEKRGFEAYTVENAEDARTLILSMIKKEESITWGGSATIAEIGLVSALKDGGYLVFDRDEVPPSERAAFAKAHFFSDWFLMSSNAITEDGELLNLDGTGNRVASLIFGPRNVIIVAGVNKITPDIDTAYARVRQVAAPRNAQRFPIQTPCKKTGKCADCLSPDTICVSLVRTRFSRQKGRVKVILIDGDYGF
ncbi:MAG: lactate utilization protein [Ruminococcaceae bacterium]|nr:lactate utilization protein [Oscillospiraceae bacterium]